MVNNMSICDLCQLSCPTAGCTRLRGEDCLKGALKFIRKSATNGDIIKALFPDYTIKFKGNIFSMRVENNWLNAPYKRGDTD